jgi:hypothetical protein
MGRIRAEQLWEDPVKGTRSNGFSMGIQIEVLTPARAVSIRAGAAYVQRGSGVWDRELDPHRKLVRNVRSHFLSLPMEGKLSLELGPVAIYLFGGPAVEVLLNTQCSRDLCPSLEDERPMTLSANLGGGVTIPIQDRLWGELEARLNEGLTSTYSSGGDGLRYRSSEILLRIRFPF